MDTLDPRVVFQELWPSLSLHLMQTALGQPSPPLWVYAELEILAQPEKYV